MKKKIIITISTLAIFIGLYLGSSIGLKFYFHDYLYETPNLKGLTKEEARKLVGEEFNLVEMEENFSEFDQGEIYSQLPIAPTHIKKGRPIKIWISKGKDIVEIPDLKGKSIQEARATLNKLGIKIERTTHTTEGYLNNKVLGSSPQAGTSISKTKGVGLLINVRSIQKFRMPDILGFSLGEGENLLRESKLILGKVKRVHSTDLPNGTIIDTNYSAGKSVLAGTVINVTIASSYKQ
ncbi:MAG: PASTA domain-containing protein [Psychrilyobacter sp.]|nr:PASTA domain-containing protein [Psychrilyobacter sp.]